jgi:hypothetical protein
MCQAPTHDGIRLKTHRRVTQTKNRPNSETGD